MGRSALVLPLRYGEYVQVTQMCEGKRGMAEKDRNGIRITNRSTFKEIGCRVEVEWQLSAQPDLEWAEIFQMASAAQRQGSLEWVNGGNPDVIGTVIRWFVPTSQIENADTEVAYRVSVANERNGRTTTPEPTSPSAHQSGATR
jgi:hypothetical protein